MNWIIVNHYNKYLGSRSWDKLKEEYNLNCDESNDIIEVIKDDFYYYLIPVNTYHLITFEDDEILCEHYDQRVLRLVLLPRLKFSKLKIIKDNELGYKEIQLFSTKLNDWINMKLYTVR